MSKNPIFCEARLQRMESNLWHYFVRIPAEIAQQFIDGKNRRVICEIDAQVSFPCALMPDGADHFFILVNQERRSKLGLVLGQNLQLKITKDESQYGIDMSEELLETFDQFEEASAHFHKLTPGLQRSLIYWVGNVKSSEIKIRRALVLVNHLMANPVKPDFKSLNAELKAANSLAKRI